MTISQWGTYFDLLQDKYGAPYFTAAWKSLFFNRAIIDYVNSYFPEDNNRHTGVNVELSEDAIKALAPLMVQIYPVNMNSSGKITKTALQTLLRSTTGDNSDTVFRVLNMIWWYDVAGTTIANIHAADAEGRPIKSVRHNDIGQFLTNMFKKPSANNPRRYETSDAYNIVPLNQGVNISVSVLKYPKTVDVDTAVDCNLPDFTHNEILARALELAGIASRDEALTQLISTQRQQK